MPTVVLLGSLDTKGQEYEFLRGRLIGHGVDVVLVDFGVMGPPGTPPDITAAEVAAAGRLEPRGAPDGRRARRGDGDHDRRGDGDLSATARSGSASRRDGARGDRRDIGRQCGVPSLPLGYPR